MGLLTRAIALADEGDPRLTRWLNELGVIQGVGGDIASAGASLEAALTKAQLAGDRGGAARASLDLAFTRMLNDPSVHQQAVRDIAEEAVATFRELADEEGLAYALLHRAEARFYQGDSLGASDDCGEAVEHARRAGSVALEMEATGLRLMNGVFGALPASEGVRLADEAAETWPNDPTMRSTVLGTSGAYLGMLGRPVEARERGRAATRLMEDLGQRIRVATQMNMVAGETELAAGDLAEAERLMVDGAARLKEMGETGYYSTAAANVARVMLAQGRLVEAEAWTVEAERNAAPDDHASQLDWRVIRGLAMARRGDPTSGERLVREGLAIAEGMDYLKYQGDAHLALAEVLRMTGRATRLPPRPARPWTGTSARSTWWRWRRPVPSWRSSRVDRRSSTPPRSGSLGG
jgi:hypothetical protein